MSGKNNLVGVQVLRGVAAILVVVHHAFGMAGTYLGGGVEFELGALGVDIFFCISGYIMVVSTYPTWGVVGAGRRFVVSRFLRVVPLYWIATTAKIALVLLVPSLAKRTVLSYWYCIASYSFVPAVPPGSPIPANVVDFIPVPVLPVGWTLIYEMYFYLLFAIALMVSSRPVSWAAVGLVGSVVVGIFLSESRVVEFALLNSIILEFVFGMFVGFLYLKYGARIRWGWAAFGLAITFVVAGECFPDMISELARCVRWGIPAALVLLAVVSFESFLKKWGSGLPSLIGDSSYPIYLSHTFVMPLIGVIASRYLFDVNNVFVLAIVASFLVSLIVGILIYFSVERRIGIWVRLRREALERS